MALVKWKNKYSLLGLLGRCYKFKGKAKCSPAADEERNDGMNHKWSRNGLMKQNLLICQFPATYKFKEKKRKKEKKLARTQ